MPEVDVALHDAAYERYLAYAMSVITSRALPDVRDGLKPVQRRILYTMYRELGLLPSGRYRKCAAVVGDVLGKYHPHGDSSVYDALVRMAQPFSLRAPLIDGMGNFGSLDGDPPAAMRYTECRLQPLAIALLDELEKRTVDVRPTYDGQRFEPIVLPAQFPQLLVNGVEGIAVGMATKIPPHHLGEVIDATIALAENADITIAGLLEHIRGPDFPTGGKLIASKAELIEIYSNGSGSMKCEASWFEEKDGRKRLLIVDSVPYGTNKSRILEKIGAAVEQKKLPQILDVRDESTDDVRIVMELQKDASAEAAMAWLYKNADLRDSFALNMTVLIPTDNPEIARPEKLDLKSVLAHWLKFRVSTVRRRLEYDLKQLRDRLHVLAGFEIIFLDLDEVIRIIRKSTSKRDAAEKLMSRFTPDLDEEQTDAILELKLYRIGSLEIAAIREEAEEKRERADELARTLDDEGAILGLVKEELLALKRAYAEGDRRRTKVERPGRELAYDEDAYIVKEDAYVVITRDGWIKRQSSYTALDKIRVRDGDSIGWLIRAHTRSTITVFGDKGGAYVLRVDGIPATTGHGEPLSRQFSFEDGERVVGVVSHDSRNRKETQEPLPLATGEDAPPPPPYAVALTRFGRVLRFPLSAHEEISTKNGRRYARLDDGDAVFGVWPSEGSEVLCIASEHTHLLVFEVAEVPVLKAAGKGVTGIKLGDDDRVFAAALSAETDVGPIVATADGKEQVVSEDSVKLGSRAQGGHAMQRKKGSRLVEWKNQKPWVQVGEAPGVSADGPHEPS